MRLDVQIPEWVYVQAIGVAAQHEASMDGLVRQALVTYLEDVGLGLVAPPVRAERSTLVGGHRPA